MLDELNSERYRPPIPLVQRRREAVGVKRQGLPQGQSAPLANLPENPFREYFPLYLEGGGERGKDVGIQGPESARQEPSPSLAADFRAQPPATIKEAQSKSAALTGRGVRRRGERVLKKTPSPVSPRWPAPRQSRARRASP